MKKIHYIFGVVLAMAVAFAGRSSAQLVVTSNTVTASVMMNKLLGPGVIGINPVLTCHDSAKGVFSTTVTSPLIFDSGVVLTSGRARSGPAGIGSNGPGFASWDNGMPGHPMLSAVAGGTSRNACLLDFDFRPAGDTVKFKYIFGSEEYNGFTCTGFNDPFAFFISGPGYATPTNIALVPGTNIPVCINSINCGGGLGGPISTCNAMGPGAPFCAYYINNIGGTLISYDGITTKLTAIAAVTPCDTYHLKLGVADITDGIYDSGVFLEAGSLTSTALSIAPTGMNPADTVAGSQYCVRGCLPAKFTFKRQGSMINPLTIHYLIGGTAVNGFDYTFIPDSVTIPASDSDAVVWIYGLVVPPTGPKTVKIFILAPYTCGGAPVVIDSAMVTIIDSFVLKINTSDTAICQGQYVSISATGDTLLNYTWSPAGSLSSSTILNPTASPTVSTTYTVTGTFSGGGCLPVRDVIKIDVYEKPVVDAGPDIQITCQSTPLQLNVNALPGGVTYTYLWNPTTDLNNPAIYNPIFTPGDSIDRWQYVTVSAPVPGCSTIDTIFLHVLPNDFAIISPDTGICAPTGIFQVRVLGDTEFSYRWQQTIGVSDPNIMEPTINPPYPPFSTTYTLTASYPKCPDIKHTINYRVYDPQVNILTSDTIVCIGLPMPVGVAVTPPNDGFSYVWTPTVHFLEGGDSLQPHFFTQTPGTYKYEIRINSTDVTTCTDLDSITIVVAPPVKIAINPPFATIPYGSSIQLNAIRLSPDHLFYTWIPNDGSLDNPNISNPMAKPLDSTTYKVYGINEWGCRDSAITTIDVDIDMTEFIPTAFTPNGDGLNDLFRIRGLKHQRIVDFKIYNRWGEMVYDFKTGDSQGWDGTMNGVPADLGVYNYSIILAKPGQIDKIYKGNVTLVR